MTYKELNIRQYMAVQKVIADKTLDDTLRIAEICRIVFGVDIENIAIDKAVNLMNEATELLSQPFNPKECPSLTKIKIDNTDCIVTSMDMMTFSQFVDFQGLSKDANEHLIEILACAIVPKGSKYNDGSYDFEEFKMKLENLPITTALSVVRTFQERFLTLSLHSATSSMSTKGMTIKQRIMLYWQMLKLMIAFQMMKYHLGS